MTAKTFDLEISLDRDDAEPIYKQLIRNIRMQIESGVLPPGTRLPASRELARKLGISRISVVNAYAELRTDNYLNAHAGRGTFVTRNGTIVPRNLSEVTQSYQRQSANSDAVLRDIMKLAQKPNIINFSHGSTADEFIPVQNVQDAINTVLDRDGASALSYEVSEGYKPLRIAVQEYVKSLGIECQLENILICGGAQQGIDLVVQSLLAEGDTLVISNPTYLGMLDIARARRIEAHGIPVDENGLRLDMLENYLHDNNPRLIYLMPDFHNPTSTVMPIYRRRQLLRIASEVKIPVLEDAVFYEFRFEGEPIPPLKALDEEDNVIHVSGFTKMMLPGMRIGYIIAGKAHFERLVRVKQAADISTSGLNQRVVHLMLQRGVFAPQMERNNRELLRRRDTAIQAAKAFFPPGTQWHYPHGGVYLWVTLPKDGPTATELFIASVQNDVAFAIGNLFYVNGEENHTLRINYGTQSPQQIREGFRRIGASWHKLYDAYEETRKSPVM